MAADLQEQYRHLFKMKPYLEKMDKVFGRGACNVLKIRKYGGMKVID